MDPPPRPPQSFTTQSQLNGRLLDNRDKALANRRSRSWTDERFDRFPRRHSSPLILIVEPDFRSKRWKAKIKALVELELERRRKEQTERLLKYRHCGGFPPLPPIPPSQPPGRPSRLLYRVIVDVIENLKPPLTPWYDGISPGRSGLIWGVDPEAPAADEERIRQIFLNFHEMRMDPPDDYNPGFLWARNPLPLEEDIDQSLTVIFAKQGLIRPAKRLQLLKLGSLEQQLREARKNLVKPRQHVRKGSKETTDLVDKHNQVSPTPIQQDGPPTVMATESTDPLPQSPSKLPAAAPDKPTLRRSQRIGESADKRVKQPQVTQKRIGQTILTAKSRKRSRIEKEDGHGS